jgi:hypothetical protein
MGLSPPDKFVWIPRQLADSNVRQHVDKALMVIRKCDAGLKDSRDDRWTWEKANGGDLRILAGCRWLAVLQDLEMITCAFAQGVEVQCSERKERLEYSQQQSESISERDEKGCVAYERGTLEDKRKEEMLEAGGSQDADMTRTSSAKCDPPCKINLLYCCFFCIDQNMVGLCSMFC